MKSFNEESYEFYSEKSRLCKVGEGKSMEEMGIWVLAKGKEMRKKTIFFLFNRFLSLILCVVKF